MGKKKFAMLIIAVVAMFAGYNVYQSQNRVVLSDLALANVEALAGEWGTGSNCRWSLDWTVCNGRGVHTGCPCGSGQW